MPDPLVSIITPTYQSRDFYAFARMLRSVQDQTFPEWEHLVVSDGIHEYAPENLVHDLRDSRTTYLISDRHYGGWGAGVRQEATKHARGEFLCFLDDDNMLLPNYLWKMVDALLSNPTKQFAICGCLHFGPLPDEHKHTPAYLIGYPKPQQIDTIQVMVRKEAIQAVGWQQPDSYMSDGYTFEKLAKEYSFTRVDECLAVHL